MNTIDYDSCDKAELIAIIDYLECKIERMFDKEAILIDQSAALEVARDHWKYKYDTLIAEYF